MPEAGAPGDGSADPLPKHPLAARLLTGERAALARALTVLERDRDDAKTLLRAIAPALGRAQVVGFTGPPGAGKSTLVSAYVAALRAREKTVGVVAVDPSSPLSGGAILGDRLRMAAHMGDDGVFIRSLASRGHVGGLSPAAVRAIDAFDAAGRDVVVIETVGAGQSEIDVAEIADTRLVLNAPGLGDDIQAMKSGMLDIADILVVNKADAPGADRLARGLRAARSLSAHGAETPILRTVATTGEGVTALADAIDQIHRAKAVAPGERRRRRAQKLLIWAAQALAARLIEDPARVDIQALADAILSAELTPNAAAARLFRGEAS